MVDFKAYVIQRDENTKQQSVTVGLLNDSDLMDGDVDVHIEHSTVNYKDGLAITGKMPVVRRFPMVPGIDFAGAVMRSESPDFKVGDRVILNGWGLGETHLGAFAEVARVRGEWLVPLPEGLSGADAMALGTAGYTAMLALMALEKHGISKTSGPVVVTGAAGGVGSVAVMLLAQAGFQVEAVTGRTEEANYLKMLGASAIIPREELSGEPKLLAKERWDAGIDAVGGSVLGNLLTMVKQGGAIAACGNAGGMSLPTSVAPFILRGVSLLGINSVYVPKAIRIAAWERLAREIDRDKLKAMTTTIGFNDILRAAEEIVAGKVRGRIVVDIEK